MPHINNSSCPSCADKLVQVHPELVRWVTILRSTHPDAHVSCGYRGQAAQEDAFRTYHSKAHFGQSAHNCVPSMAIDLFRITQSNQARFDWIWYELTIAPIARAAGLTWGGDWKTNTIKDAPHIEMPGFVPFKV